VRRIEDPIGLLPAKLVLGINKRGVHFFRWAGHLCGGDNGIAGARYWQGCCSVGLVQARAYRLDLQAGGLPAAARNGLPAPKVHCRV
jgi:hypothetical protein